MRLLLTVLLITLISGASAQLDRGVKGDVEDVILVGADDWHATVAATPLAVWSEGNTTVINTLLVLPGDVQAGKRMGWVEQSKLDEYGAPTVIHTLKNAGVSSVTIHGEGDVVEEAVEIARKEGMKAYVTAGLMPSKPEKASKDDGRVIVDGEVRGADAAMVAGLDLLRETGIDGDGPRATADLERLQKQSPGSEGTGELYCPVDPEAREELYTRVEEIIEDYEADGVVLCDFGFEGDDFCYCDFCQEEFYKDTGIDLTKIHSSDYNQERWNEWKQDQVMEIVSDVRNITSDLGPVDMGVALNNPFDRSQGYDYAEIIDLADLSIISPVPADDARIISNMADKPVYIRLSEDYIGYTISAQNVEGTIEYIEDLISAGAGGIAFEYDVVYTPIWYELEPPTGAARWLLSALNGRTLAIGNVSWDADTRIEAESASDMAAEISERWDSSPGVVIVGNNYSAGLSASVLASYLNWPVLFADDGLTDGTRGAIERLDAETAVVCGLISEEAREDLAEMNLTVEEDDGRLLLREMKSRGESPNVVVMTNSHDLSLIPPAPESDVKRIRVGDVLMDVEASPTRIPAESNREVIRLNITLRNVNKEPIEDLQIVDPFPMGRMVRWPRSSQGEVVMKDPYGGGTPTEESAFINGSIMLWKVGDLDTQGTANLAFEVEMLYPMDVGWEERVDGGMTFTHRGLFYRNITVKKVDDWPVTNITYPPEIPSGVANISWNLDRAASFTSINVYGPDGARATVTATKIETGKRYRAPVPMVAPGTWRFNIEAGDGYNHRTPNYTIEVVPDTKSVNVTAFSHTKVPRTSLTSAPLASARKALIFDLGKDPQDLDPMEEEERMNAWVDEIGISPEYLITVGDPGSLPFIESGLDMDLRKVGFDNFEIYDIYRDYEIDLDDDNYSEVATGRIVGLSVYDASQLVARTLAYDKIAGAWKDRAIVISTPGFDDPYNPIPLRIEEYLEEAGLDVQGLHWEDATYQKVVSQMGNGQNLVHFSHHGSVTSWLLSDWSMMDIYLDKSQVKELVLAPQTTTTDACQTARLKGFKVNLSGNYMFMPFELEDSMALAFVRAGSVSYVGVNPFSWIFVSDDHSRRLYQALIYENATIGRAMVEAGNLHRLKADATAGTKDTEEYDDLLPPWDYSVPEMLNQTATMFMLIGDPCFRPYIPSTPPLPYEVEVGEPEEGSDNSTEITTSITPRSEQALDWVYWVESRGMTDGVLSLNAPPALVGEMMLPKDAEEIVVKEDGRVVWHDEDEVDGRLKVIWPVVRPTINSTRSFTVEYRLVPGETQMINITAGWNAVSVYVDPNDPSAASHLKGRPYRGIFTASGGDWKFTMKETGMANVTSLQPGQGYLVDANEDFTMEIEGKPVDLPFRLKLQKGWNMIGVPFNTSVNIDNITVNAEHRRYSYPEAVEEGIVSAFLWRYDDDEWTYLDGDRTLDPGRAYLVEAMTDCRLEFRQRPQPEPEEVEGQDDEASDEETEDEEDEEIEATAEEDTEDGEADEPQAAVEDEVEDDEADEVEEAATEEESDDEAEIEEDAEEEPADRESPEVAEEEASIDEEAGEEDGTPRDSGPDEDTDADGTDADETDADDDVPADDGDGSD